MRELGYFLSIDKPADWTSRDAVNRVAKLAGTKRVGHAGTLDPLATGVLVVAVERATRLVEYVQAQPKSYEAIFQLGATSDTDDIEGELTVHTVPSAPSRDDIERALASMVGTIEQRPPTFSAVKVAGQRAYKHARKGTEVDIAPRPVTIHAINLVAFEYPSLRIDVQCGSGTYIRSIARDLGQKLGTGAVMSALRRTAVGVFRIENSVPLAELTAELLAKWTRPLGDAVAMVQRMVLGTQQLDRLLKGQAVAMNASMSTGPVAVFDDTGALAAIASYDQASQLLRPSKAGFAE